METPKCEIISTFFCKFLLLIATLQYRLQKLWIFGICNHLKKVKVQQIVPFYTFGRSYHIDVYFQGDPNLTGAIWRKKSCLEIPKQKKGQTPIFVGLVCAFSFLSGLRFAFTTYRYYFQLFQEVVLVILMSILLKLLWHMVVVYFVVDLW